jgi:hypothetical protein
MARVTAYEASDGSLHRDRKAYLNHESNLVVSAKLKTIIAPLVVGETEEARARSAHDVHDFIVNGIGLNTLRELFAVQFKPGADDGEGAGSASTDGAPAAGDGAPAAGDAAPAASAPDAAQAGDI